MQTSRVGLSGVPEMLGTASAWSVLWVVLFYSMAWTEPRWGRYFSKSAKPHENDCYWSARQIIGILHALVISVLVLPVLVILAGAPADAQFCGTPFVGRCAVSPDNEQLQPWSMWFEVVAMAGMAFTTFTLVDVFISLRHGLATWDYVAHHVAFITAGAIIRSNCMMPYNAAILLAMEVSTPFLNTMLFLRNRGVEYTSTVQITGSTFFLLFVIFRLFLNTYGVVYLWMHFDMATPDWVPRWQLWFLTVAVTAGAAVQFFWFPSIAKLFGTALFALIRGEDGTDPGDDAVKDDEESAPTGSTASSEKEADIYNSSEALLAPA